METKNDTGKEKAWLKILETIQTPLGFYVLVVLLVAEIILGSIAFSNQGLIIGMLVILVLAISAVTFLTYKRSDIIENGILATEKIEELTQRIVERMKNEIDLVTYSTKFELIDRSRFPKPFDQFIRDARPQKVDMLGLSLLATISSAWDCLREQADGGCEFRFLLVDPGSPAVNVAMGSVENTETEKPDVKSDVEHSLRRFDDLLKTKNVQVRFTRFAPSFSLLIIDPERDCGTTQVELYGFGITPISRPHFVLSKSNQRWFDFFIQQFEKLWEGAKEYTVSGEDSFSRNDEDLSEEARTTSADF